jgi:hypothetical protein
VWEYVRVAMTKRLVRLCVVEGGQDMGTPESDVQSFDVRESVHRDTIMKVTNTMQLRVYTLMYYS